MSDQSRQVGEGFISVGTAMKVFSLPAFMGLVAGSVGFLFLWPADRKEGFTRLLASAFFSHFFGPPLLYTALHFLSWIPSDQMAAACFLIAGLPGWWILGWLFKWLGARQNQDAAQVAHDIIEGAKHAREIL